ncbi:hypothetical protein THAOC_16183 [Thalassiosira oceanica]|uniref:Coatomer subunit beta n=1 Tax=Thalassiosira oceanica TaxID=159749 RepID=K0SE22_THAOC|nr:hypothetical protein THAOC_16183 [Thalassiosira oceanica]|eukprot:EJK63179.1 hypothetical protein THAOC_16183 [Thalassiosira oceanica]
MPTNSNESYCTFTLASDVTAGGLPSEEEIAKQLENNDPQARPQGRHHGHAGRGGHAADPDAGHPLLHKLGRQAAEEALHAVLGGGAEVPGADVRRGPPGRVGRAGRAAEAPPGDDIGVQRANERPEPPQRVRAGVHAAVPVQGQGRGDTRSTHPQHQGVPAAPPPIRAEECRADGLPRAPGARRDAHPRRTRARRPVHQRRDRRGRPAQRFLMLYNESEELAIQFLARNLDDVSKFGDGFALLVLDLTRKACRRDPNQKSRFVRVLFQMLSSDSAAVSYEAAWTLISLSNSPTAVRAAAATYTNLLNSQNDNNVMMIVLERLEQLQKKHSKILQELLQDILRALSSPNPDICSKVLDVAMTLVTSKNVSEVVTTLKREVAKTTQESSDSSEDKGKVYRNMLITAIHGCAVRFPDVAGSVVDTLMDFLSSDGGMQVIIFVRTIVERYPDLRPAILSKLISTVDEISNGQVMCICLWILGEYCETAETVSDAFETVTEQLGDAPFVVQAEDKQAMEAAAAEAAKGPQMVTKNVVLADGTYATQTVYSEPKANPADLDKSPHLRKMVVGGDIFLGTIVASSLTKMCLRAPDVGIDAVTAKGMAVKSLLAMCGIVKMAEVSATAQKSSLADCSDRVSLCCRALLDPKATALLKPTLLEEGKSSFAAFLRNVQDKSGEKDESKEDEVTTQADDLIHFRQLRSLTAQGGDLDLDDGSDLARATGYTDGGSALTNELSHVYQLSGFADPVYAEAFVRVHDYDILLEILIINRTPNTLANLTVELSTMGDMKIVERPQSQTIGPLDQMTIRASIKVSSTETGHIFGTIVYEDAATQEKGYVNLNDIHMDIMDYIRPATCTDEVFRSMWAEFEWENKVAISTSIGDLVQFLDHIVSSTNMTCLTPHGNEKGSFLAANLYAKSVFGEDALVNVSVEKKDDNDGKLAGYIRIRSKTQGIALSLGDRITSVQRAAPSED